MCKRFLAVLVVCAMVTTSMSGCALVIQKGRRSDLEKISTLEQQLQTMKEARQGLEDSLSDNKSVKIEMQEKGLVITVLAEVLFDSGKAKLRSGSNSILDEVAGMLTDKLEAYKVGVEGHTDNDPITKSNWKSNWELSAHRALSVLHSLIDSGVSSDRLSVLGYGEFQPVASNSDKQNKQLNRRVEIVVYPKTSLSKKDVDDFEAFFK